MLCVAFQSYTTDQNNYIGGVYMNLKKPGYKNLVWPLVSRFFFDFFICLKSSVTSGPTEKYPFLLKKLLLR